MYFVFRVNMNFILLWLLFNSTGMFGGSVNFDSKCQVFFWIAPSTGDLPHQLFHKEKGDKWEDKLTRKERDIPSLDLEAWQDSFSMQCIMEWFSLLCIYLATAAHQSAKGIGWWKMEFKGGKKRRRCFVSAFILQRLHWNIHKNISPL